MKGINTYNTSEEKNFELKVYQIFFLYSFLTSIPTLIHFFFRNFNSLKFDSIIVFARVFLNIYLIILIYLTFHKKIHNKINFYFNAHLILYVLTIWRIYLVYLNNYKPMYFITIIVTLLISVILKKISHFVIYTILFYSLTLISFFSLTNPEVSKIHFTRFLMAFFIAQIILYFMVYFKIYLSKNFQDTKHLLENVFHQSADAILLLDYTTMEIIRYNQKIVEFLKLDKHDKKSINDFILKKIDFNELKKIIQINKPLEKDIVIEGDFEFHGNLSVNLICLRNKKHLIIRITDITQRKIAENELKESNIELKNFTRMVSHDLKEPLNSVTSYLSLLKVNYEDKINDEVNHFILQAMNGAKRMGNLIEDLLAYTRVDSTRESFDKIDTQTLVQSVLNNLDYSIHKTNAKITYHNLNPIFGNKAEIFLLFQNLISNSLKYIKKTDPPKIEIHQSIKDNSYLFSIKDNGIGIKKNDQDKIFNLFERLDGNDDYPGTGLGLSICKKIIEKHNGKIWVESNGSHGSTFFFCLPQKQKEPHD